MVLFASVGLCRSDSNTDQQTFMVADVRHCNWSLRLPVDNGTLPTHGCLSMREDISPATHGVSRPECYLPLCRPLGAGRNATLALCRGQYVAPTASPASLLGHNAVASNCPLYGHQTDFH